MLDANSQEVKQFLEAWHENGRADFEKHYDSLDYDSPSYQKHAKTRKRFIACDRGTSGMFLIDRNTALVYSIKAYGVPNRLIGHLGAVTRAYQAATAVGRDFAHMGYVGSDHALRSFAEQYTTQSEMRTGLDDGPPSSIIRNDQGSIMGYQAFAGLVLALGVFALSHGAFALAISFFAGWR